MKVLDLCAGIGGFSLGFQWAGFEIAGQVEIDPWCNRVLSKHWPDVPRFSDVRELVLDELPRADVICGGFPCQPFSIAGKRGGSGDDRYLWPEMVRVVRHLYPTWVVFENVVGFVKMGLQQAIADLEALGYGVTCFIIPACAVNADHQRKRVFIVAHNGRKRVQGQQPKEVQGIATLQGGKNVGGLERIRERSDLPKPLFWGGRDGVPHWVDRLRGLGNAVVPQVAYMIGSAITSAERGVL